MSTWMSRGGGWHEDPGLFFLIASIGPARSRVPFTGTA
jgi:hypothetical protein